MASVCLVREAADRRTLSNMFSEGGTFFSVNDMAHFESDIMTSKGGSILSEGISILYSRRIYRKVQYIFRGRYHAFRGRQGSIFQEHGICLGGGAIHLL